MVAAASTIAVREYFGDHPGMAFTVLACGFPSGVFIFSLITRALYDNFSFFGAFIVSAAIMMNVIVCGLLFRPVATVTMKGTMKQTSVYEQMQTPVEGIRYTPTEASTDRPVASPNNVDVEKPEPSDKDTLKPKDPKTYHAVEGPTETMVVSTLEKSWKFEDTVLYEDEDDEEDGEKEVKVAEVEMKVAEEAEDTPEGVDDQPDGITEERKEENLRPIGPTLLEVIIGVSEIRTLCDWRLLLFILSCMVYSLGYGIPFCLYPDVARYHGKLNGM